MRPNFTECGLRFLNSNGTYANYTYHGPVTGVFAHIHNPIFITAQGCNDLCGSGVEYYSWKDISSTITTWVLPIVGGVLVQAPWESNRNVRTFWTLARFMGNPMAILSYIFWNIRVTGLCASIVDMATEFDIVPGPESQWAQMRDSFYVLSVMNQYSLQSHLYKESEATEYLLRITLFSDSLNLARPEDRKPTLNQRRSDITQRLRENRKRGVVAVFVSFLWFLVALAISIQSAFGHIGENQQAHDLALGFLLGWLPILVLASIVDRNPIASGSIRSELNHLLSDVRKALLDDELRGRYMEDEGRSPSQFAWTTNLIHRETGANPWDEFFTEFAGQGRERWHYGVAHPMLAAIEKDFLAGKGRNWLEDPNFARTRIILDSKSAAGLRAFDPRMTWQILGAICLVCGNVGGAFILSYFTPTVGLGCRSGGYMIFMIIAFFIFMVELLTWALISAQGKSHTEKDIPYRADSNNWGPIPRPTGLLLYIPRRLAQAYQRRIDMALRCCEVINTVWLIYIVTSQTIGAYQKCECMTSSWDPHGGYMDFETFKYYREHGVTRYWGGGTGLAMTVMTVGFAVIVKEYTTQSHLSTENYEEAKQGLMRTRRFMKRMSALRKATKAFWGRMAYAWRGIMRKPSVGDDTLLERHSQPRSREETSQPPWARGNDIPMTNQRRFGSGSEPLLNVSTNRTSVEHATPEAGSATWSVNDGHSWGAAPASHDWPGSHPRRGSRSWDPGDSSDEALPIVTQHDSGVSPNGDTAIDEEVVGDGNARDIGRNALARRGQLDREAHSTGVSRHSNTWPR